MKATTLILQLLLLASIQQATAQEPDYEGYWCCASSDCYATTSGLPQHIQCLVNTHSSCTRPTPNACGGCTDPTGSGGGIATHAFDPNTGTCYDAGKLVGMPSFLLIRTLLTNVFGDSQGLRLLQHSGQEQVHPWGYVHRLPQRQDSGRSIGMPRVRRGLGFRPGHL